MTNKLPAQALPTAPLQDMIDAYTEVCRERDQALAETRDLGRRIDMLIAERAAVRQILDTQRDAAVSYVQEISVPSPASTISPEGVAYYHGRADALNIVRSAVRRELGLES